MEALDEAVGLGSADLGGAVLDLVQLEEQLLAMAVGATAELTPVVAQYGRDPCLVRLEGGQDVVVHDVTGSVLG